MSTFTMAWWTLIGREVLEHSCAKVTREDEKPLGTRKDGGTITRGSASMTGQILDHACIPPQSQTTSNFAFPPFPRKPAPARIESRKAMEVVRVVEDGASVQWFSNGESQSLSSIDSGGSQIRFLAVKE
jgi:hypothetical protein